MSDKNAGQEGAQILALVDSRDKMMFSESDTPIIKTNADVKQHIPPKAPAMMKKIKA
jgi:hypothetical protein